MARVIRLNSTDGSSSSSAAAGLTLSDVENTFNLPRRLQTIDVTSNTEYVNITGLDAALYERFYIEIVNMQTSTNNYLYVYGMSGTTRWNDSKWSATTARHTGSIANNNSTGSPLNSFGGNSHTSAASYQGAGSGSVSKVVMTWDFWFPRPTDTTFLISGRYDYISGAYGEQTLSGTSFFNFEKSSEDTHADGIAFRMQNGQFSAYRTDQPMRFHVFGYKRATTATVAP